MSSSEKFLATVFILTFIQAVRAQEPFDLSIIHINDFHAKFEPVSVSTSTCAEWDNEQGLCYGGVARLVTATRELQQNLPNPLLLNGGDSFQGSLLYTLFKWNITLEFMNRIPFDVTALGNHEFDDGVAGAEPYMAGLQSPLVAVNMDASEEPDLQGKFLPSKVLQIGGRSVGVIGCISKYTNQLSNTGKLKFLDEVETVSAEVAKLHEEGVDIIVLLSHSGHNVDQRLALKVPYLDVIVGAHSHSFLYTGTPPSVEIPSGEYPTVVTQEGGRRVLIVQAYCYSKYVGVLKLQFDKAGEVTSWEGNPVIMDSSVVEDPETKAALQPWVDEANKLGLRTLGTTAVFLDQSNCYRGECNLGSFITDAMVAEQVSINLADGWTGAAIAIMNPGGLRSSLGESPNITYNDLVSSQPFANSIDTIELQGKDILEILEMSASRSPRSYRDFTQGKGCMQVSGIQATYNFSNPAGSRVVEVLLRCARCRVPELQPVQPEEWYNVAMPSFLSNGGSGFTLIKERGRNKIVGLTDVDVFAKYIARESPIMQGVDGRIKVLV